MEIGYTRVSANNQCESLDYQIKLLKKSQCNIVYSKVVSEAKLKRLELTTALEKLKSNNMLIIASIDRLERSLKKLVSIIFY